MSSEAKAIQQVTRARSFLVQNYQLFGSLALRQKLVSTEVLPGGAFNHTMATDGKHIFINPEWTLERSKAELVFLVAHEALHPGFCHHLRRGDRDPERWNMACDLAINPILVKAGLTMPEKGLLDWQYAGMNAEAIYNLLPESQAEEDGEEEGRGQGAGGEGQEGEGQPSEGGGESTAGAVGDAFTDDARGQVIDSTTAASPAERSAEEREWKLAASQAAQFAPAGSGKGMFQDTLKAANEAVLDWGEIMLQWLTQTTHEDYSYARPNKRFVAQDMYLPSRHSEDLSPWLFIIDVSGSHMRAAPKAIAEVERAMNDLTPEWVDVIFHDDYVLDEPLRFEPGDEVEVDIPHGGGTSFAPVCDWIAQSEEEYSAIIWFTDLETWDWDDCQAPDQPLIWVDWHGKLKPQFGDEHVIVT